MGGRFEGLLPGLGALLLELFQLGFGQGEGAGEALLIETEASEEVAPGIERFGLREGAVDGGVRDWQAGMFINAEREEIVFHGADAVEAPVGVGDGLHSFGFEQTVGLELGVELGAGV